MSPKVNANPVNLANDLHRYLDALRLEKARPILRETLLPTSVPIILAVASKLHSKFASSRDHFHCDSTRMRTDLSMRERGIHTALGSDGNGVSPTHLLDADPQFPGIRASL